MGRMGTVMRSRAGRAEAQGEDAAYGGVAKLSGPAAEVRDIGVFLQRKKGLPAGTVSPF